MTISDFGFRSTLLGVLESTKTSILNDMTGTWKGRNRPQCSFALQSIATLLARQQLLGRNMLLLFYNSCRASTIYAVFLDFVLCCGTRPVATLICLVQNYRITRGMEVNHV
jgi:hypothetical protein